MHTARGTTGPSGEPGDDEQLTGDGGLRTRVLSGSEDGAETDEFSMIASPDQYLEDDTRARPQPAGEPWWKYRAPGSRPGARWAAIVGALAVIAVMTFVILEMRPGLIFGRGVDVGGDNGGHIAAPYFMLHDLLPHLRLTGWDSWWFDGFPLYVFYFPLPALLVSVLTAALPYSVAFKIVTALGTVTLPLAGYAFGRLAGFKRPVPVLMGAAMLPFLFNTSYTIDGGNVASTMAGEFSFSLAITTGLLFLGVVAYSLRTGRLRWLAAVLFGITCVCHVIPALVFGATAIVMAFFTIRPRSLWRGARILVPIGVVGALLAAWWLIPFAADLPYSSSMNYSPVTGEGWHWLTDNFFPHGYLVILIPAAVGIVASILERNRVAFSLSLCGCLTILAFHDLHSGVVYNARWLPFWFLYAALVAAYGAGSLFRLAGRFAAPSGFAALGTTVVTTAAIVAAVFLGGLEGSSSFLGYNLPAGHLQVGDWVSWNYSGIQADSGWGVWKSMIRMLDSAGKRYGCGRLQFEYIKETQDPFGSTDSQMSIPMYTNGCMQTTDGIYYESSTTNPFHFLDVSQVSQAGETPDPVVGLNYPPFNVPDGIRHLQLMGVRYFLAMTPLVESIAAYDHSLVKIGSVPSFPGPYNGAPVNHPRMVLYLIKHSPLVVPLTHLPTVEAGSQHQFQDVSLRWYESERYWPDLIAHSGPATWPRARMGTLVPPQHAVPTGRTSVSNVKPGGSSLSFDVSRTGTPVLVKIPYFPNWTATGADGPYEVSPNLMAVIPTSHHVTLTYGTSKADWVGKAATLAGIAGAVALFALRPAPPAMGPAFTASVAAGGPSRPAPPEPAPGSIPPAVAADEDGEQEEPSGGSRPGPDDDEADEGAPFDGPAAGSGHAATGLLGVSVVLPAHNEESLLASTVREMDGALAGLGISYEIVIIENGSGDLTRQVAAELASDLEHVCYGSLPFADYGSALRAGFLVAQGRTVVIFDVDYWDVAFLREALADIDSGAAVVLASKRASGSSDRRPLVRRVLTAGFAGMMRTILQLPVTDAHGMKALERATTLPLVEASTMTGPVFDVEVVARAHRAGLRIVETPAVVQEIRPPRTGVFRRSIDSLVGLIRLRWSLGPRDEV